MNNNETYRSVFENVFAVNADVLNDSFNFKDVASWDSFTHLTLISELEAAFDVMFEPEDILHFGGYENGKNILKKYGVEFE